MNISQLQDHGESGNLMVMQQDDLERQLEEMQEPLL
jgi:hypothetical protein